MDRTPKNPNLLAHAGQIWLIDHGAALPFQYDWARVSEDTRHAEVDPELAAHLTRAALDELSDSIPASLLDAADADTLLRTRRAYAAYLYKRLEPPRRFLEALS